MKMKMHKCKWNDAKCLSRPRMFGCICGKGGSSTTVYQPTPPPQPSTADAIKAWTEAMPEVFAMQQEFAPQEAQQQLELLQQYGLPMAQAYKSAQEALNPETTALQEKMAGQASKGMEAGMPSWMRDQYKSDLNANLGNNVGSGVGADYVSRGMLNQQQNYQNYYRNLGLSLAGRQQLAQPSMPQASNYMAGFTPGQNMNYLASNYGTFAQASRPMTLTSQWQSGFGLGPFGSFG